MQKLKWSGSFHQGKVHHGGNIKESTMIVAKTRILLAGVAAATVILALGFAYAQQGPRGKTSYMPVDITEPFSAIFAMLSAQKPDARANTWRSQRAV